MRGRYRHTAVAFAQFDRLSRRSAHRLGISDRAQNAESERVADDESKPRVFRPFGHLAVECQFLAAGKRFSRVVQVADSLYQYLGEPP